MISAGAFLEWAEVHGNLYGTPRVEVDAMRDQGLDVLLDMDVQGVESIRSLDTDGVFCLILPPSFAELKKRLGSRGKDAADEIERRMTIAVKEVARIDLFDYVIVNDDLELATTTLESVIRAEHSRRSQIDENWFSQAFLP